ncbi:TetR/AcrR family transcriptional regulator [Phenylobacterium sp.]|jgi:AcrR family transcriptional regulator|uniref:TetR/AcrR family transcriptional regulator n=1 Tax=Phenylobacterium sp. TaxID=1871053 RepID=UPI002F9565B4
MAGLDDGEALKGARMPTRRFEARRNAIIASAVSEINVKGVRGMTLGDVAARLDLVPTGVIYYFKNKEELAAACFLRAIERYDALVAEGVAAGRDDRARLQAFIEAFLTFKRKAHLGEAEEIAILNDARGLNSPAVGEAFVAMFRHARDLLQGPPERPLPRLDRSARTHLLLAEVFWGVAWLQTIDVEDYGRIAHRMGGVLADGILPAGAAWPAFELLPLAAAADPDDPAELFLGAATELINQEGYHGASVERISARLNVSKGAFYHHNATKDELVVACFQRTFQIMWRAIRAAEADGGTGMKVLAQTCVSLVHHQLTGRLPLLRSSALSTVPKSIGDELIREFDRISLRFASMLCDGIADRSVRPVDVYVAAQLVSGMINASADLRYWAEGLATDGAAAHYVRPLFEGLLSPAPAA